MNVTGSKILLLGSFIVNSVLAVYTLALNGLQVTSGLIYAPGSATSASSTIGSSFSTFSCFFSFSLLVSSSMISSFVGTCFSVWFSFNAVNNSSYLTSFSPITTLDCVSTSFISLYLNVSF